MVASMEDMAANGGVKKVQKIFNSNPILVVKTRDTETSKPQIHIIDGHHRYFAFNEYNKRVDSDNQVKTIPAKVINLPPGKKWDEVIKGTWELPGYIGQKDLIGHTSPPVISYGNP